MCDEIVLHGDETDERGPHQTDERGPDERGEERTAPYRN